MADRSVPRHKNGGKCVIDGCERASVTKSLCNAHYLRQHRYGSPTYAHPMGQNAPLHRRILSRLRLDRETGCWVWTGAATGGYFKYPVIHIGPRDASRAISLHRMFCDRKKGPLREGEMACHRCDNPLCINPAHLFRGTHADNMDDCVKKGRRPRGEKAHNATISEETARMIRDEIGLPAAIARKLNVSVNVVRNIRLKRSWLHLPAWLAAAVFCGDSTLASSPCPVYDNHVFSCDVAVIWDADTFRCRAPDGGTFPIRLWGIAAPERGTTLGNEAGAWLRQRIDGATLFCRANGPDSTGDRCEAQCWTEAHEDIGALVVRAGQALDCKAFSSGTYEADERTARESGHDLRESYRRPAYCEPR